MSVDIRIRNAVKRYGDRVNSRMASMCNYIELTGPDRRKMR